MTLVSAGAEVDRIAHFDQQMRTPLGAALSAEAPNDLRTALLSAGADPDREELFGKTPRDAMKG